MLRTLCVIALVAVAAQAQQATLKVGDDAPPLSIAKWVKGDPVTFEKGKIYVVEFWATWCGPCIASMPHLSELQDEYRNRITFIGVTTEDTQGNTLDAVEKMVQAKGPGMGYTVAWDDAQKTNDAWMKAAAQRGIPTSFVVDANGKIAFIGHPIMLEAPLAQLVAGKWDPVKGTAEIQATFKRAQEILQMDRRMALDALPAFEKEHPELASFIGPQKFRLLLLSGKNEEASAVGTKLIEKAVKYNDVQQLNEVSWLIVDPKTQIEKRDLDLAMNAATKAVELSKGEDGAILDTLARVYYCKGDLAKAIEIQTKAVAVSNAEMLGDLQDTLDQYKAEAASKKE